MKSRHEIKSIAKTILSKNYAKVWGEYALYIVSLSVVCSIEDFLYNAVDTIAEDLSLGALLLLSVFAFIIFTLLYNCLIVPIIVGYYDRLKLLWWKQKKKSLFSGFQNGRYWRSVFSGLAVYIITITGFIFFFFPGVICIYLFRMVPFIISDSEKISTKNALKLSITLVKEDIFELIVFDLSYFGWGILKFLTFGILHFFYISPYKRTALAGYYTELKKKALEEGIVKISDFGY